MDRRSLLYNTGDEPPETVDIAIVGGGAAGCYTALRLSQLSQQWLDDSLAPTSPIRNILDKQKGRLQIALFEYSERLGGRVWSLGTQDGECAAVLRVSGEHVGFGADVGPD